MSGLRPRRPLRRTAWHNSAAAFCDPSDLDEMLEQITAFIVGGLMAREE
jgi:hypothetical protein